MPHGTCTCSYCQDQGEAVKGEGGEKIKKKPKEGRSGQTGQFCYEKFKVQSSNFKVVVAGGACPVLKIVCVEPPPSAVHAKAKAPAPHFSGFAGEPQAHEELS
jgi:hypothetical protein